TWVWAPPRRCGRSCAAMYAGHATSCVRSTNPPRGRTAGSRSRSTRTGGRRHAADRRGGPLVVVAGGPAERDDQDPGDTGGAARDQGLPGREDQRERDAHLLGGALPRGDGRLSRRYGTGPEERPQPG